MSTDLPEERLRIMVSKNVSRGKAAAAAVHAALYAYGIDHGAVIVLSGSPTTIEESCDLVIRDAGRTEVEPGTVTGGILRDDALTSEPSGPPDQQPTSDR